jgi:glycosyltransferase involved in cell wall biosynthesis
VSDSLLRVCMVSPLPPPYGGISHWTSMICRYAYIRKDIQLQIIDIAPRWRAVHDLTLWKRLIGGCLQGLRNIFQFSGLLCTWRPEVIHLTTAGQLGILRDLSIMILAGICGIPVVYHIRFGRIAKEAEIHSWEWKIIAWAMRRAHTVIAIDSTTEDAVRHHLPDVRVVRVPNCVNLSELPQLTGRSKSVHTAVFLGWVIPNKGLKELIEAWTHLQKSDWRLRVIGPGNRDYIKQLVDEYKPERVDFIGELTHDDAMKQLAEADVFVLPSYTEGFPNVVLEAMSLGKPVVASNVGSIPEMLADGCGVLVKPKDVQGLMEALRNVCANEKLRVEMGERARMRAMSEFSIEVVFPKYMEIWRQSAGSVQQDRMNHNPFQVQ